MIWKVSPSVPPAERRNYSGTLRGLSSGGGDVHRGLALLDDRPDMERGSEKHEQQEQDQYEHPYQFRPVEIGGAAGAQSFSAQTEAVTASCEIHQDEHRHQGNEDDATDDDSNDDADPGHPRTVSVLPRQARPRVMLTCPTVGPGDTVAAVPNYTGVT